MSLWRVLVVSAVAFLSACKCSTPEAPAPSKFPDRYLVRGIDVSHHNGEIDWPRVAQNGIHFVYVKATEGGDRADPRFEPNLTGARSAGLKAGAYHFFTFCRPGEDQAKHFLSRVKLEPNDLPPAVDVEFVGNCKNPPARAIVRENLEKWLTQVESALGRKPIIYSTPDAAAEYLSGLAHHVWMRLIPGEPTDDWTFWQFHSGGSVPGIMGTLIWMCSAAIAMRWIRSSEGRKVEDDEKAPSAECGRFHRGLRAGEAVTDRGRSS